VTEAPLLEVRGLTKHFALQRGGLQWLRRKPADTLRAVQEVDFTIREGRTVGVVGETGSGKSTLGRLVLGLERPTAGTVLLDGKELSIGDRSDRIRLRKKVQVVLQDPYTSLNPYITVGDAIGEVLKVRGMSDRSARRARTAELLSQVGFPAEWVTRKPGQLSGGGRQRVSIARALAAEPRLLVADEPVSALDVSVQAQVLNVFQRLQAELGLAYLFITHDLAVLERIADDVIVLYLGRIVEAGPVESVFKSPAHPYTQALLNAAPELGKRRSEGSAVAGEMPNPITPPSGCAFHPRCPVAMDVCRAVVPEISVTPHGQQVACHLYPGSSPAFQQPSPVTAHTADTSTATRSEV
jgi:oligopeptide/dipeptide ABC transporter ATP-binding protein